MQVVGAVWCELWFMYLSVVSVDGPYLQIVEQPKQVRLTCLHPFISCKTEMTTSVRCLKADSAELTSKLWYIIGNVAETDILQSNDSYNLFFISWFEETWYCINKICHHRASNILTDCNNQYSADWLLIMNMCSRDHVSASLPARFQVQVRLWGSISRRSPWGLQWEEQEDLPNCQGNTPCVLCESK